MTSRRDVLKASCAVAVALGDSARAAAPPADTAQAPRSLAGSAQPIGAAERQAHIAQVQKLMRRKKVGALLVEQEETGLVQKLVRNAQPGGDPEDHRDRRE